LLTLLVLFVVGSALPGQESELSTLSKKAGKLYRQAEQFARQRNPEMAFESINKALKIDQDFIEGWLLLAEMLQEEQQNAKALSAFQRAFSIDSMAYPHMYFSMGKLAFDMGNYPLAVKYYHNYIHFNLLDSLENRMVLSGLKSAQLALKLMQHPFKIEIHNMGNSINTADDEFINFLTADDRMLVMTRKIRRDSLREGDIEFAEGFYQSRFEDSAWTRPQAMHLPWIDGNNAGGMSMSADGRSMLFTGCYWPDGNGSCDIYYSNRIGRNWEDPVAFNDRINTPGWESQPVISADGKTIYFTSKRAGGIGGADIWRTNYIPEKGWSTPINLGDSINTPGDEMAPFIHGDGQTLYFSSNGHPGLGGYDLFYSRKDKADRWSSARNMGVPINTKADEVNLFVNLTGTRGWISSNRMGSYGGMDIWDFQMPEMLKPKPVILLAGIVVDSVTFAPLQAQVEIVTLPAATEIRQQQSDRVTGEFLVVLNPKNNYIFNIYKKGYLFYSGQISRTDVDQIDKLDQVYALRPVKSGEKMNLYNVFFDFNSDKLLPASTSELDRLINLLNDNPSIHVQITGHTDSVGTADFNFTLSQKRANSVMNYLVGKGVAASRLITAGLGDTQPIASNTTESGRALNRRTEITIK
jgi:outer membrane protein OmpA-like peptidoglycan-associated protein